MRCSDQRDRRHVRGYRVYATGVIYHLRTSTVHHLPLLADEACKQIVLDSLRHNAAAHTLDLLAYVVMPDHVHLVVQPQAESNISDFMASFKKRTARRINEHLGRRGAVWRKEFFDHMLRSCDHLDELIRYIHDNPVRRGLAASAEEWACSSWQEICGSAAKHPDILR